MYELNEALQQLYLKVLGFLGNAYLLDLTKQLLDFLYQMCIRDRNKSGLHLCLPACSNADMRFYHIDESTEYRKSRFGIWEPVHALPAEASQLDIVLVPLVAFDEACNRMGHGCGYYDRYQMCIRDSFLFWFCCVPSVF